ncbi:MAG: hypothetical protein EOL87_06440 [Spartobacteria bacterium]|nr:hypothetical protein [Spartobacteria bacterium]
MNEKKILIGNALPLTLIRRSVTIIPAQVQTLRDLAAGVQIESFWGHENTLSAVSHFLGIDLTPKEDRPSLQLTAEKLPILHGTVFQTAWIISPNYSDNLRPAIGEEVALDQIESWQVLRVDWDNVDI